MAMSTLPPAPIYCPHCKAKYRVIRIESAWPETTAAKIPCQHCGSGLDTREGAFTLSYFLLERPPFSTGKAD
jgi:hypothetical protein